MSKFEMLKDFLIFTLMLFCITFFVTPFYMMYLLTHFEEIYVNTIYLVSVGVIWLIAYTLLFIYFKHKKNE